MDTFTLINSDYQCDLTFQALSFSCTLNSIRKGPRLPAGSPPPWGPLGPTVAYMGLIRNYLLLICLCTSMSPISYLYTHISVMNTYIYIYIYYMLLVPHLWLIRSSSVAYLPVRTRNQCHFKLPCLSNCTMHKVNTLDVRSRSSNQNTIGNQ